MSLEVKNLSFSYQDHDVLKNISFSAEYGQVLSVLGPNGVGKSTLFRCMLGLLHPQQGDVLIDGHSIHEMSPRELSRHIAYIPQSHSPVFNFSVFDMVLMGTTSQLSNFGTPQKKHVELVDQAMEKLGISHLRNRGYANVSGGERQLALIARALVQNARILVMDEPSASLDYGNRIRVMQTVRSLAADGYAIIQSTHDPDQAYLHSDQVLALYQGQVLGRGTPRDTICSQLISTLYGVDVDVCSLREDLVRVCIPANRQSFKQKGVNHL